MGNGRYTTVLLFGVPGSGKGTQGKVLGQLPGFYHLSSGDVFRTLEPSSDEGRRVREFSKRGELVPDDLTIQIWKKWLDTQIANLHYQPTKDILLLDGIPRNVRQCEIMDDSICVRQVLYLASADDGPMIERIKNRALVEGRPDDADEKVICRRFDVYREESAPILSHYSEDLIAHIDPLGTPAEVLTRVLDAVIPVQNAFLQQTGER